MDCLEKEPLERELEGRRLLGVSREAIKRIACLAMAYRLTADARFLHRAIIELDAVSAFEDWNPSHFLDVAEMATAVGIGYDWLHDALNDDQRTRYREAILSKALTVGLDTEAPGNWWIKGTNNWNQVCHGGLTLAALAIAGEGGGDIPSRIVRQALENIGIGMQVYEPEGAYPEGPGYWDYGTTYNVIFLDVLQSALGSDFGVTASFPGFLKTARYRAQLNTPAGLSYNFSDNGESRRASPTLFWFGDSEVSRLEYDFLAERAARGLGESDRFLPLDLIWLSRSSLTDVTDDPLPLSSIWGGKNPVAVFRTSWSDPNAAFLGFKGGAARISHGQMDAGSFIYEVNGIRWAVDLGAKSYHHFESQGIQLWDMNQDGERWTLMTWNTLGHSLLRFPGFNPDVDGRCDWSEPAAHSSTREATADLTALYPQFYDTYQRMTRLEPDGSAVIEDRIESLSAPVPPQWNLLTRAQIEPTANGALLRQDGRTLRVEAEAGYPLNVHWESAENPPRPEEPTNPGLNRLTIEPQTTKGDLILIVRLTPQE
ncbi:MAG: heparinase II/III family protein [Opitutaceae bacterium]